MNELSAHTKLAIVDDEPDLRSTVQEYLSLKDMEVAAFDGADAFRRFLEEQTVDLVVLDINMPGEDGLSLARWLRQSHPEIAIVMLTAATDTIDRIVGLEMGADDYVGKPVDLRELLARIKAVLRRLEQGARITVPDTTAVQSIKFGTCRLDLDAHKLYDKDESEIRITAMEYDLLQTFATNPNKVLNRDQLLDMAHNKDWEPFDRSIDIRIARIRKKVEEDPTKPAVVKTVRGVGYIFTPVE
jgi:two-component system phosphate regulon response regulator OmpR